MPATSIRRTLCLTALSAAAAGALAPAAASAATVHATPGGLNSGTCATPATACGLFRAVETVAGPGDTVVVGPGKYSIASTLDVGKPSLTIVGAPGPRPLIEFAATLQSAAGIDAETAAFPTFRHLAVRALGTNAQALRAGGGTFSDLEVQAPAEGGIALFTYQDATIANSTFVSGQFGHGIWTNAAKTDIRNVSVGGAGTGIYSASSGAVKPVTRVHNSIVHGDEADFRLQSDNSQASHVVMDVDHSSYRPTAIQRSNTWATFNDQGGNVAAAALLTNPIGGDFHQLSGSPTVDRGSFEAGDGATDIDGAARVQGAAIDIGADELDYVPPATVGAGAPPTRPAPTPADPAPVLSSLKLSPAGFRVSKRGGTRIGYRNSEAAPTRFTVQRRKVVRRHGKRKVVWTTLRGGFTHADKAGANRVAFTGKLNGRALTAGTYRLVAVSRDAKGQKSVVRRAGFTVKG